ncbi:sensor histidine kinase [Rhodosalinus halophilus]|uniref:histidine kinase n=1 Tax=Rhodosalinus halophilus TaxID=2259333 RepID=A0A365U7V2_9RHOB|nr:ActS/PrrB/RegB family redox-sensitive histidine kinase [Rhodosalinus halophilus]RBI84712.1 sensor histidine kinase [Rhodosalinus halophilus]
MSHADLSSLPGQRRRNWIRLRTLILLRWMAISGQLTAVALAHWGLGIELELGLCITAIGAAVIVNLIATFVFPETKRLSERETAALALFDILQLGALLYLTGGLHNPFALLLLGPVTVSASVLTLRPTLLLGGVAVAVVTALGVVYLPLRTGAGDELRMPEMLVAGTWAALVIALVFLSIYSRRVSSEMHAMSDALSATQMALAREQKLTDLGGVVAAAAHELGTPLATIKLTSAELMEDLDDRPDLREDAALIRDQADRCRDILRSMGRAGKEDLHTKQAPLEEVVREAVEPHEERGKRIERRTAPSVAGAQPSVLRRPEIIHGLRNLVQNAVDFARSAVWVETGWTADRIWVRIADDGPGFPPQVLARIGEPFMRSRRAERERGQRPGYEGMGLGLFIAKTLLERSGADLTFANGGYAADGGAEIRGALVEVSWPRRKIDAEEGETPVPRGQNRPLRA